MKTRLAAILIAFLFSSSAMAFSQALGPISGGGGKGVQCFNSDGETESIVTLDLYEARVLYELNVRENTSDEPLDQAIDALKHLAKTSFQDDEFDLAEIYEDFVTQVYENMILLPEGVKPKPVDDHDSPIQPPENCQFVQIALMTDQEQFIVNGHLWSKMSATEKGALLAHEVIYSIARSLQADNSRRSRKAVAHAFARTEFSSVTKDVPEDAWVCSSDGKGGITIFYVYANDKDQLVFDFETFGGIFSFDKTIFHMGWMTKPEEMFSSEPFSIIGGAVMKGFERGEQISVKVGNEGLFFDLTSKIKELKSPMNCTPPSE